MRDKKIVFVVLGVIVALGLGCVLCCGGVFGGLVTTVKSSDPYVRSLTTTRQDPGVQQALGTPLETGFMPMGKISLDDDTGRADLSYTLTGPKATADVVVRATKSGSVWTFTKVLVTPESGDALDLTRDANAK